MSRGSVLVTGATGMVGMMLAPRLIEEGYDVAVMMRPTSNRDAVKDLDVRIVEGDLADLETLGPAVSGMDYVVHSAAQVGDWGPAELFRQRNVYALEHMIAAAQSGGTLKRWIQISSLGIYPARPHFGTDETVPADLHGLDGYTRTKAEAEVLLKRHIDEHDFPAVILRPGFIYGPGDRHVVPRIIENLCAGKMKIIGDGQKKLNNTNVHNLVDAVILGLEAPDAVGETFNIRDERLVTREEFVSAISNELGVPYPRRVPEALARFAVVFVEGFARMRGATQAPFITRARLKFLAQNLDFSIDKAKKVLGYQPRVDFTEGMQEALAWARSAGIDPDQVVTSATWNRPRNGILPPGSRRPTCHACCRTHRHDCPLAAEEGVQACIIQSHLE